MKKYIGPFLLMAFLVVLIALKGHFQHLALLAVLAAEFTVSFLIWVRLFARKDPNKPVQIHCLTLAAAAAFSLWYCARFGEAEDTDGVAALISAVFLCLSYGIMDIYLKTQAWAPMDGYYMGRVPNEKKPDELFPMFLYELEGEKYSGKPLDYQFMIADEYEKGSAYPIYVNRYIPSQFTFQKPKVKPMDFIWFGYGLLLLVFI